MSTVALFKISVAIASDVARLVQAFLPTLRTPFSGFVIVALRAFTPCLDAAPSEFQQKLRPVLEEHCFKCHNAEKHKGGIDLTQFDSEGAVLKKYKLWRRVIEAVQTEQMPPDDDKFTPMHGEVVVGSVKKILGAAR